MCGIAGMFGPPRNTGEELDIVRRMLGLISHRGPDESGIYVDMQALLGSVRLSILDVAAGQQPMCDASGRFWIAYNGEIYNYRELRAELETLGHRFRTTCDTEVALEAWAQWGADAVRRFNGCFAFALYDTRMHQLVLGRDRVGKRPLYYTQVNGLLLFASEMKAFLTHPNVQFKFDAAQLASIFANWAPLPWETGYLGVRQLSAGALLHVNGQGQILQTFAELPVGVPKAANSFDEAVERTREELSRSVQLRMRSDVEVGTYLSGGLDSAIVTRLAIDHGARGIHSFSVSFEEPSYDEAEEQQEIQKALGVTHHTLKVTNAGIAAHFPAALWHAEVPVFRTAFVPMYLLAQEVRRQGIKVVLTGEGADEAFVGYDHFKETWIRSRWNDFADDDERRVILSRLYPFLSSYCADNIKSLLSLYWRHAGNSHDELFALQMRHNMGGLTQRILHEPCADPLHNVRQQIRAFPGFAALDPIGRAQWLEFRTLLAGYLLSTQGDRMALSHGVENRCPFLDMNVLAWANSLPREWKLDDNGTEKLILRKAFEHQLPTAVSIRPKRPYRAPDLEVFRDSTRPDYLDALLSPAELAKVDILDASFCGRFLDKVFQPSHAVHPRDCHTFMFILSIVLLHRQFVCRQSLDFAARTAHPATIRDFRNRPAA